MPIVQASMGIVQTWDTHVANFPRLRDSLLPHLDRAVSRRCSTTWKSAVCSTRPWW